MQTWDLTNLEVQPHQPEVLGSETCDKAPLPQGIGSKIKAPDAAIVVKAEADCGRRTDDRDRSVHGGKVGRVGAKFH